MGKESLLQKQIKENDLQRMRNLVQGKYGDSTTTQVGYKKQVEDHQEGDIWEENGKNWTIRNGIKTTLSKLDPLKKIIQIPLNCPCCKTQMKNKLLDNKMFFIHKMCFNCVSKMESKLKIEGKYTEYKNKIMSGNINSFIDDIENYLEDILKELSENEQIVTDNGEVENWGKTDQSKIKKEIEDYIKQLKEQN
jgi:hypothetical protein